MWLIETQKSVNYPVVHASMTKLHGLRLESQFLGLLNCAIPFNLMHSLIICTTRNTVLYVVFCVSISHLRCKVFCPIKISGQKKPDNLFIQFAWNVSFFIYKLDSPKTGTFFCIRNKRVVRRTVVRITWVCICSFKYYLECFIVSIDVFCLQSIHNEYQSSGRWVMITDLSFGGFIFAKFWFHHWLKIDNWELRNLVRYIIAANRWMGKQTEHLWLRVNMTGTRRHREVTMLAHSMNTWSKQQNFSSGWYLFWTGKRFGRSYSYFPQSCLQNLWLCVWKC